MTLYGGLPYAMFERFFLERHATGSLKEVEFYRVRTHLMNDDREGALKALGYMGKLKGVLETVTKTCEIAKFVPGTHHYCLGKKFDTVEEARAHARREGYTVTRVFGVDGTGRNAAALREVMRPSR